MVRAAASCRETRRKQACALQIRGDIVGQVPSQPLPLTMGLVMLIKPPALCLMVALVLGCGLEPRILYPGSAQSSTDALDLSKLPPSEMRGMIERYAIDRGGLGRSYPVEISPA